MAPYSGAAASALTPQLPAPVGEICFNTGMTGYQETLTDPSYAGQIITFTFPHIGNVGTNLRGHRGRLDRRPRAGSEAGRHRTVELALDPTLDAWLRARRHRRAFPGSTPVRLTTRIRDGGAPTGVLAFPADGRFDLAALRAQAEAWPGLEGMDLATGSHLPPVLRLGRDRLGLADRLRAADRADAPRRRGGLRRQAQHPALPRRGRVQGHGGAGDRLGRGHSPPSARRSVPVERSGRSGGDRRICGSGDPGGFGAAACRCSGFASAISCWRWRWARRPSSSTAAIAAPISRCKDLTTGKVEITSQNHGFAVDLDTLPETVTPTHVSLFDGSNEGLACTDRPAFSVQYHPEASPGRATAIICSTGSSR